MSQQISILLFSCSLRMLNDNFNDSENVIKQCIESVMWPILKLKCCAWKYKIYPHTPYPYAFSYFARYLFNILIT